jgi:hypothetical protein
MDLCVQVSIDRLTGDFRDASVHLLAQLSMLPAGATTVSFWLKDLKDTISPVLDLLFDAALVRTQQSESGLPQYTIHPVIRDYILDERRYPSDVLVRLLERAYNFLETNKYSIGDAGFKERAAIIRTEETNLQEVLLIPSTADVDDGLIDALLLLAKHCCITLPRALASRLPRRPYHWLRARTNLSFRLKHYSPWERIFSVLLPLGSSSERNRRVANQSRTLQIACSRSFMSLDTSRHARSGRR